MSMTLNYNELFLDPISTMVDILSPLQIGQTGGQPKDSPSRCNEYALFKNCGTQISRKKKWNIWRDRKKKGNLESKKKLK